MLKDVLSAALLPGWAVRRRSAELAGALLALGTGVPLMIVAWALWSQRSWIALTLDQRFLTMLVIAGIAALAARLLAVLEVWFVYGRPHEPSWRNLCAAAVALAVIAPIVFGVVEVSWARSALGKVFDNPLTDPLFSPAPPVVAAPRSTVEPSGGQTLVLGGIPASTDAPATPTTVFDASDPLRPVSGIDPSLHPDVSTILLLGGDAGPGRSGLRTDTMMLFSIHRPSGRAGLISIPRDMVGTVSPPGSRLREQYPDGWPELLNAIYPLTEYRDELRSGYLNDFNVPPGVWALTEALGYSLDVQVDDYVLIDMRGFQTLIDALGGVTVYVPKSVPMPGNVPGAPTQYPDHIGPGTIHMDGSTALGYVRSRKGDSDYQRTRRQRDLLAALAQQISFGDVLSSYRQVAQALGNTLRTSLTAEELTNTLEVIGGETAIVESVGLVPPLVPDVKHPDWSQLARVVAEVQVALATGDASGY